MDHSNYYNILGVAQTASTEDIKSAYRKLCVKWHPDKAPKNNTNKKDEYEKKFKDLTEAYNTLVDTEKRQIYDNPINESSGNFRKEFTFGTGMGDIFSTFFGDMSGGNLKPTHNTSSFSQSSSKNRNFDEKAFEKAFDIPFFRNNTPGQFVKAHTNTYNDMSGVSSSDNDNGSDTDSDVDSDISEDVHMQKSNNTRHTIKCTIIDLITNKDIKYSYVRKIHKGNRLINNKENINVKIPLNHDISKPIIIENMGSVFDKKFAPGDLELTLDITPYKNFKLDGKQLIYTISIDVKKATNGFAKTITCLNGEKIKIKVDALKTSNDYIAVTGKGIYGEDMIIKFNINFESFYVKDSCNSTEKNDKQ